ncbi:MAG: hypothetical protein NPINA01_04260 [Nitrospinaceae bacterium]|nr:MAG: hypothetical protein NPINA01_04260 [Nitrospinaceae bacterium]
MSEKIYGIFLLLVVVWPLLLAIPALHSRLPRPRHLAVMPAVLLIALPGDSSLAMPWLLFGTGLAVDGEVRWILLMSVAIWLTAATVANSLRRNPAYDRATTFFLLTLAGNLGAVLAADLVGFFGFSTLMGYGFYGLVVHAGDAEARRAGRLYLIFLIVADLFLFEALLLAAFTTGDLRYEAMRQSMAGTFSSQFYLWMALAGFALKAGIWPVHLWLTAVFKSAPLSTTLLLGGVPVAMGLLGAVRWLPFGENAFYVLGMIILTMGVAAILYAVLRFFMRAPLKVLPAWGTVLATGLFTAALGAGLAHPAVWSEYEYLTYPFIASLGIFLAAQTFAIGRLQDKRQASDVDLQRVTVLDPWVERWMSVIQRWAEDSVLRLRSLWRESWLKAVELHRIVDRQKPVVRLGGWSATITMFVLLGLVLAWLAE